MPELINGTYVSAIVLALLIPALINCKCPLRPERPLRYKHCHNVILSEAKNLGSARIWRKTEMDQRCLKAWPHASHFVAALLSTCQPRIRRCRGPYSLAMSGLG